MSEKTYRVVVCYEEGFVMEVEADSAAAQIAEQSRLLGLRQGVHRDYWGNRAAETSVSDMFVEFDKDDILAGGRSTWGNGKKKNAVTSASVM